MKDTLLSFIKEKENIPRFVLQQIHPDLTNTARFFLKSLLFLPAVVNHIMTGSFVPVIECRAALWWKVDSAEAVLSSHRLDVSQLRLPTSETASVAAACQCCRQLLMPGHAEPLVERVPTLRGNINGKFTTTLLPGEWILRKKIPFSIQPARQEASNSPWQVDLHTLSQVKRRRALLCLCIPLQLSGISTRASECSATEMAVI